MDKHNKHIEWKETGSRLLLFTLSFLFLLLLADSRYSDICAKQKPNR